VGKNKMTKLKIAKLVRKKAVETGLFKPDFECACAIMSVALAISFRNYGYDSTVIEGYFEKNTWPYGGAHCWVVSDNERWDLTITQFGIKKVIFVGSITDKRFKSLKKHNKLTAHSFHDWPDDQKPLRKYVKLIIV